MGIWNKSSRFADDQKLSILVPNPKRVEALPNFIKIKEQTHLFHNTIELHVVNALLRNEAEKVINQ